MFTRVIVLTLLVVQAAGAARGAVHSPPPSSFRIAFGDTRADYDLFTAAIDGSARSRITSGIAGDVTPDLSGDGTAIAVGRSGAITVLDRDGSNPRVIWRAPGRYGYWPAWSPDGGRIAFVSTRDCDLVRDTNCDSLLVIGADGSAARVIARGNLLGHPSWSPDGRRIAFTRHGAVVVINQDGSEPRQLQAASVARPSWSPDGARLVVQMPSTSAKQPTYLAVADAITGRVGNSIGGGASPRWSQADEIIFVSGPRRDAWRLMTMAPDGSNRRPLSEPGTVTTDWSGPVRGRIVYSEDVTRGEPRVFEISPDGSGLERLVDVSAISPVYSPDGMKLAFLRREGMSTYLAVLNRERAAARNLVRVSPTTTVAWSPDNERIAFASRSGLRTISASGGPARLVRGTTRWDAMPDWSPSGRYLAFVRAGRGGGLFRIRSAGGRAVRLRRNGGWPDWSPSGKRLAYVRYGVWSDDVWTMRADGTRPTRITRSPGRDTMPRWTPDGRWIVFGRVATPRPWNDGVFEVRSSGGRPLLVVRTSALTGVSSRRR